LEQGSSEEGMPALEERQIVKSVVESVLTSSEGILY
jgi:hypothetical protein